MSNTWGDIATAAYREAGYDAVPGCSEAEIDWSVPPQVAYRAWKIAEEASGNMHRTGFGFFLWLMRRANGPDAIELWLGDHGAQA